MAWWGRVWSGRWVSGKSLCSWWWTQFSLEQEDPNRTGLCGSPRADSCNADSDGVRRLQAAARGANKEGPIATLRAESCRRNCPGSDEEILSSCEDRRSPQSRLLHLEQRNVYEAREEQKINTNPLRAWTHHDSNVTESVRIRPAHEHRWGEKNTCSHLLWPKGFIYFEGEALWSYTASEASSSDLAVCLSKLVHGSWGLFLLPRWTL